MHERHVMPTHRQVIPDKTVLSVSCLSRRCELDSRRLKTVADRKYEVKTRSEQSSNSHRHSRHDKSVVRACRPPPSLRRRPGRQLGLAARPPISSDVVGLRQAKVNTLWTATYEYRPKYLHYTPRDRGDLSANCSDFARRSRESKLNSHRLTSQHRQHCLVAGVNWALRCMGTPKCPCD